MAPRRVNAEVIDRICDAIGPLAETGTATTLKDQSVNISLYVTPGVDTNDIQENIREVHSSAELRVSCGPRGILEARVEIPPEYTKIEQSRYPKLVVAVCMALFAVVLAITMAKDKVLLARIYVAVMDTLRYWKVI